MDELIKKVESLLSDIDSMRASEEGWFGTFSEFEADDYAGGANIEWPNLAISADDVRAELTKLRGGA